MLPSLGEMLDRVLLVDDHPVVRGAVRLALGAAWPQAAVVEAESLATAAQALQGAAPPQLVILDLRLLDGSGLSNLVAVQRLAPQAKIVIFSALDEAGVAAGARRLGAHAFVSKTASAQQLVATIRRVLSGEQAKEPAAVGDTDATRAMIDGLSAAQLRVLLALGEGSRNGEIAQMLRVTEATVKAHLTAIYRRLGVRSRTEAVLAARRLGAS